jgi:hypothetical protein
MSHLRVYRFDPGATFQGGIIGAIERAQLLGGGEVLDALFVGRNESSGEAEALSLAMASGDNRVVVLTDFRLDAARRRELTQAALAAHPDADGLTATLEPGAALLAMLVGRELPGALADAVARARGRLIGDEPSDAQTLTELGPLLHRMASSSP